MPPIFPAPLTRFLHHFENQEFWEGHEVLEGPWRRHHSEFYKGLILLASAWVHVQRGNRRGVLAQLRKADAHLRPFAPAYLGVDVDAVLEHTRATRARLAALEGREAHAGADWIAALPPPRLRLERAHLHGTEPELSTD